ncbi:Carbohydrate-binding-like fold [Artemisia annua]|uniref:Carbohydrate-binding-like fold n=1 Tax=Artemisia annua TaxID=35608 RepID=A0A2U1L8X2_ARTAN|nr:Carbohydrate-binding-like fold [Artemisia annua]
MFCTCRWMTSISIPVRTKILWYMGGYQMTLQLVFGKLHPEMSFGQVFVGAHYVGDDLVPKFGPGEPWKKVFGPVFIYLNSTMCGQDPHTLWDDAKRQMMVEDFPKSCHIGNVRGRLLVRDRLWVYGDSFKLSLVAVVVPNKEHTEKWRIKKGIKYLTPSCVILHSSMNILSEFKSTAERNKLRGFEHIKGVIEEPKTLEEQADLLTAT